jgi:hypothetical protein
MIKRETMPKFVQISVILILITTPPIRGDHTYDPDPSDPFDSDRAKVLLFGRSGQGKSSIGNVLIGLPPDGIPRKPATSQDSDEEDDEEKEDSLIKHLTTRTGPRNVSSFTVDKIDR